jgi:hypothetical protein
MRHGDDAAEFVGLFPQFDFPQAHARTIAAAAVRDDRESLRVWVTNSARRPPSAPDHPRLQGSPACLPTI